MKEKYFKMLKEIKEEKLDITKLYILSCCYRETEELNYKIMEYTYDCWIEADIDLDLCRLTDIVCENWEAIQEDKIQMTEIIEKCVVY